MHRSTVSAVLLASLVALLPALPVAAQGMGRSGACKGDIARYCEGLDRGHGAIARCLGEHEKDLSPECRDALKGLHERIQQQAGALREACADDFAKYCSEVRGTHGARMRCLEEHRAELSQACTDAMKAKRVPPQPSPRP
jgi:hypothetical protein